VANQVAISIKAIWADPVFLLSAVLLLPIILTSCFRHLAFRAHEDVRKEAWAAYRKSARLIVLLTVVCWWVTWCWRGRSELISIVGEKFPGTFETSFSQSQLFWVPITAGMWIFLFQCYTADKTILRLKWTVTDTLRHAWWTVVKFVIPLLMVAAGFDSFLDGRIRGFVWLVAAGVVAKIGTGFLRRAEGMKFNVLKSGETRNRALSISSRMGVTLNRIYVVPAGKGHLTNAYGMSNAIALTDNLGKYLTKPQIDYVIAHELAHVKLKHGRKQLRLWVTVFSTTGLFLFFFRQHTFPLQSLFRCIAMLGPLMILYYCSRRFEYAADQEAVAFSDDPETAIQALANLHRFRELPEAHDHFTELFTTHPTFSKRVRAIANDHMPSEHLVDILRKSGVYLSSRE
jgi:Zn-dependent protease with chaperone function